jgi:hypothetical protein
MTLQNPNVMRNYNEQIEAAYLSSRRQGDMMRDRNMERSPHQDRSNRLRSNEEQHEAQSDFRGKGPRNYRPSDERLREKICDLFCEDPHLDATDVDVKVQNAEVILSGFVEDRFAKRLAEDLVEKVNGVTHIENRIRVNQDKKQMHQSETINQEVV